jgi:5-carboxymethyl-2-hydroxymuconate isomerase
VPQIAIEYSSSLAQAFEPNALALRLHQLIVETIDTELISCKTRLVEHRDTVIGDGAEDQAMLHLDIRILSGRSAEEKRRLGEAVHAAAVEAVEKPEGLRLQVTAEVRELDRDNYHKLRL